ncbi:MAG: RagB/SusD family nutrient uptake outer membrane protein [Dehalococcoidia bacterium]
MSNYLSRAGLRKRAARRFAVTLGVALAVAGTLACGDLLEVELPGVVEEESLEDPQFIELFLESAIGAFECAFTNYVLTSANVTDEMYNTASFENFLHYDQRTVDADNGTFASGGCGGVGGLYTPLSQARFLADETTRRAEEVDEAELPNKSEILGRAALYAGYSYTLFGEGFCESAFDNGPLQQPAQVLELADQRFTTAITHAEALGDSDLLNTALVGRARVRLDLGKDEEAAADARRVPEGFVWYVTREDQPSTRENKVFGHSNVAKHTSVDREFWDMEWDGTADPRVELVHTGELAFDGLTPLVLQTKYTSRSDDLPLARHEEALLIIAEAEGGQTAVDIINLLHERAGLPPFTGTELTEVMDHLVEERRRELFLEGHRINDLLRLGLGFPTGENPYNRRPYGDMTCFPLPNVERLNNPNIG